MLTESEIFTQLKILLSIDNLSLFLIVNTFTEIRSFLWDRLCSKLEKSSSTGSILEIFFEEKKSFSGRTQRFCPSPFSLFLLRTN